jgi:hypothetical protein
MTVDELMHMVRNAAAAWHRDESLENPRVFKFPAAEAKLRDAIEQALSVEWENGRCAGVELNKQALAEAVAQERERCAAEIRTLRKAAITLSDERDSAKLAMRELCARECDEEAEYQWEIKRDGSGTEAAIRCANAIRNGLAP